MHQFSELMPPLPKHSQTHRKLGWLLWGEGQTIYSGSLS